MGKSTDFEGRRGPARARTLPLVTVSEVGLSPMVLPLPGVNRGSASLTHEPRFRPQRESS